MKLGLAFLLTFMSVSLLAADESLVGVLMDGACASSRTAEPVRTLSVRKGKAALQATRARKVSEPDPYETCKATPASTSFALHTDGKLYLLDEAGNDIVLQQMRNESFRASLADDNGVARWLTVMVEGRVSGDRLTISSLRR